MVEAWWGSVTQTCQHLVQGHRRPQQNGWSISSRPALSHSQDLYPRFLGTHQSLSSGREDKEWLVNDDPWKGRRREQRRSSGPAGHFLGIVTKAHDGGEEGPQDLAGAACSHQGLVYTSQPPLHHHKPKNEQLAQTAKSQMSFCWYLSKSQDSVGCKEARAT